MHYDGGTTHIPQTQHVPHCTPRATNEKEHRDHLSPQQSLDNTRRPASRNPTQPRRQRLRMREDPVAAPRGERDIAALRTHRTCWTRQGTRLALRLNTWDGGDINPFPECKNTEHKAHRPQDRGKGTPPEDPIARGSGYGEAYAAWRLPQNISSS